MNRLQSISKETDSLLRLSSPEKQRLSCVAACDYVVNYTGLSDPLVLLVLNKLRSNENVSHDEKSALDALVTQLDDEYFRLQDEGSAEYMTYFSHARAVSALSFASENTPEASSESIYEAATSVDDNSELLMLVKAALEA